MAFWRKKNPANQPAPPKSAGSKGSGSAAMAGAQGGGNHPGGDADEEGDTRFLSGDALKDRRSVEVLLEAIARVSESRDLEALLDYVVDRSIEVTGAERGFLVLLDEEGKQEIRVARERGNSPMLEDVKYSTTVVGRVLDEDAPMRTTVQSDAEALELGASVFDLKLRAVMCVPLRPLEEGVDPNERPPLPGLGMAQRGALYVDSKAASRAFNDEDLSLFFALAKHIAIALENARLNLESVEKARLQQALEIASEIQSGLMPKKHKTIPGFEVFGWYRSAEHASGDFYDFVITRDKRLAVVVGDVTGHGIGPALITATAQASLRSFVRVLGDPADVVNMLNEDLAERMDDGMFLTLFLAYFSGDGTLQVVNAGHTPPLVWRRATGTIDRIDGGGPAVGMMDDFEYSEGPVMKLEVGDCLLAVTDGLVEARHKSLPDRLFDEAGMRAVLSEGGAQVMSAQALTEELVRSVMEFTDGKREDDMTVVVVRRIEVE